MSNCIKCFGALAVLFLFGCGGDDKEDGPGGGNGANGPAGGPLTEVQAAAQRSESRNKLKQIAFAMHNHHDTYRKLPASFSTGPGSEPLLSWRVHLLPYLGEQSLFNQFHLNEPWDSDHNEKLVSQIPSVYVAPGSKSGDGKTNYVTFRHESSAFPPGRSLSLAAMTDGTANTLMVVEVNDSHAVTWTKPDDLDFEDGSDVLAALIGLRQGGFLSAFVDGSVHFIPDHIDRENLTRLIKRNDGQDVEIP